MGYKIQAHRHTNRIKVVVPDDEYPVLSHMAAMLRMQPSALSREIVNGSVKVTLESGRDPYNISEQA